MAQPFTYIRFFRDLCLEDIPLIGGKNASLGEMYRALTPKGVLVPNGFVVTAEAYRYVLESAGAWGKLHAALDGLDANNVQDLTRRGKQARDIVYGSGLPADLRQEICTAYHQLQTEYGPEMMVAVRSSATAEDLPTASFAGQHDTYLHITGDAVLLDACQRYFASLFTNRAIHYRSVRGFDHFKVFLSIGIMKMVRSDLAASGVIFTLDTESAAATSCLLLVHTAWAKMWCRALSTQTSSTYISRRLRRATLAQRRLSRVESRWYGVCVLLLIRNNIKIRQVDSSDNVMDNWQEVSHHSNLSPSEAPQWQLNDPIQSPSARWMHPC